MIEIHWTVALAMSFCSMFGVLQMYGRRIDAFFKRVVDNMLRVGKGSMKATNYSQQRTESELYQVGHQERKYEFGDYIRQQSKRKDKL